MDTVKFTQIRTENLRRPTKVWGQVSTVKSRWIDEKAKLQCGNCGYTFRQQQEMPYKKLVLPLNCPECGYKKGACNFEKLDDPDGATKASEIDMISQSVRFKLFLIGDQIVEKGDSIIFEVDNIAPNFSRRKSSSLTSFMGWAKEARALTKGEVSDLEPDSEETPIPVSSFTMQLEEQEYNDYKQAVKKYWKKGGLSVYSCQRDLGLSEDVVNRMTTELGISFRNPICYSCGQRGHDESRCPVLKPDYDFRSQKKSEDSGSHESTNHSISQNGTPSEEITLFERGLVLAIPLIVIGLLVYVFIL